ncbi:hypothetical protein M422DRAFT_780648 [Sphaerobolus stellatus SS14]|uniref:Uncharacterized protein n=1 Tax=Sphaerobolus stellatus (strain SS14) TaxID=990650 RepID=A0A0C9UC87_SPHS4|nr:hypothetical protein M422DRAFT_780648 [Sphaerobolus stellatus SS14]
MPHITPLCRFVLQRLNLFRGIVQLFASFKEASPVCIHAISTVWHELGEKIYKYFDSIKLKRTSIDPVRFAEAGKEPGPLFLWMGVLPGTLSPDHAKDPAVRCKEILLEYKITDIEIVLLDVRIPFIPALGLQIAPKAFPYFEGTGCLFLCGEGDQIFLLTTRHVALPPSEYSNVLYYCRDNTIPHLEVIHLGGRAFQNALEAIMDKIGHRSYNEELVGLGKPVEGENRQALELKLVEAEASKASVLEFHRRITSVWSAESQRILGHDFYAPPISVGAGFTEDWALIELNRAKFEWDNFQGNVIYLGSKLTAFQSMKKMYPQAKTRTKFKYPPRASCSSETSSRSTSCAIQPCWTRTERSVTLLSRTVPPPAGVTLGRATGIKSHKDCDGAFSAPRDSGSIVGDAESRIVGMLIGAAGQPDDECIKKHFPNYYLFPTPA